MSVTSIENARDLGALAARIGDALQVWRVLKFLPDVGGQRPRWKNKRRLVAGQAAADSQKWGFR